LTLLYSHVRVRRLLAGLVGLQEWDLDGQAENQRNRETENTEIQK